MPQASTRRRAPRGIELGLGDVVADLDLVHAGHERSPHQRRLLLERREGLLGGPAFADHARQRARDGLGVAMHEDVASHRAADRAGRHRLLHPGQELAVLQPRAAGQHDRDPVGGLDAPAERVGVARPVRLHDVGAELRAQPDVPAQVLEPVLLLELLDRRVRGGELGLGDERHARATAHSRPTAARVSIMPASVSPSSAVNRTTASAPSVSASSTSAICTICAACRRRGSALADSSMARDVVGRERPVRRSGSSPCSS